MKKLWICLFAVGFAVNVAIIANAFAQDEGKRVVEEKIVLKDPTVAEAKKWVIGGSLEYWRVSGPYDTYDGSGKKISSGTIDGNMPGGNVFVGYDKFTLQYSYRQGEFDIESTRLGSGVRTKEIQEQKEQEITLRYLFYSDKTFNPYVLIGYSHIKLERTDDILTSGWVWSYNMKTRATYETVFKSPFVGVGVIVPLTKDKDLGIRGDLRGFFTNAEYKRDDGYKISGDGVGAGGTATVYWNIFKGLNLQVGAKAQYLNGGDAGSYGKWGTFASVGYAYRF